jgi:hypothetical protein
VSFFTPDINLNLSGSNALVPNPFVYFPDYREPGLPFYAAPSLTSNYYFYWLYHLFYTNGTRYLCGLMGLEGISVFVVLYGTNSASFVTNSPSSGLMPWAKNVNASTLMPFQFGLHQVLSSKDYAIYECDSPVSLASPFTNTTLVVGNFSTLNEMAESGWNLSRAAIVFPDDLALSPGVDPFNGVGTVVLDNMNDLLDLALPVSSGATNLDPLSYVQPLAGVQGNWTNSLLTYSNQYVYSSPAPFLLSHGAATISVPVMIPHSESVGLWAKILYAPESGKSLTFTFLGQPSLPPVDPNKRYGDEYNTFVWTPLKLDLSLPEGRSDLTITSTGGVDGIEQLFLANETNVNESKTQLLADLANSSIPLGLPSVRELGGVVPSMVPVAYTSSGYSIPNYCGGPNVLVRTTFSPTMVPHGLVTGLGSMFSSMNTVIYTKRGCGSISVVPRAWTNLLVGGFVSLGTFFGGVAILALVRLYPEIGSRRLRRGPPRASRSKSDPASTAETKST